MEGRKAFLSSHLAKAESQKTAYRKRSRIFSWLRLLMILSLLGISYWAMQTEGEDAWLWAWLPGLSIFLLLVRGHLHASEQANYFAALADICSKELAALAGTPYADPLALKLDPKHPYARELDVLGKNSLHQYLNRSFTHLGSQALAEELLDPPYLEWQSRQAFFKELELKAAWSLDYRAQGALVEDQAGVLGQLKLWSKEKFKAFPSFYWLPMLGGMAAVWYFLLSFAWAPSSLGFQYFLYALSCNLVLLGSRSKVLRQQHQRLGQISDLMASFTRLIDRLEKEPFESDYAKQFFKAHHLDGRVGVKLKKLSDLLSSLDQSANAVALVVLNGLFHYHLWRLRGLEIWHQKHSSELEQWLKGLYRFEGFLSIANYQANHPHFISPILTEKPVLEAQGLGHPLIKATNRVSNDLSYQGPKYIILTGSNMSGKSTFLRTLGANLLLAQMGTLVCAEKFRVYPFQLLSSMNPQDDLGAETSYFQAEVLRLRSLLDRINSDRYSFFLLDEILRGTNSNDKQEGTRGFLHQIENMAAWGIIATHDVDIAHMADANPNFRAAYFESKVEGEDLLFDYKLREGICKTPNASLLMRRFGLIANDDI